jgi:aspartate/methionine/tyrosine aminotransferase
VALAVIANAPDFADDRLERDRRRTEAMARGLRRLGCRLVPPSAAFYVWFRPPPGREALGFQAVVRRAGIAAAPGQAFGPSGAGWLRFACVQPGSVYPEVLQRLGRLWGQ